MKNLDDLDVDDLDETHIQEMCNEPVVVVNMTVAKVRSIIANAKGIPEELIHAMDNAQGSVLTGDQGIGYAVIRIYRG